MSQFKVHQTFLFKVKAVYHLKLLEKYVILFFRFFTLWETIYRQTSYGLCSFVKIIPLQEYEKYLLFFWSGYRLGFHPLKLAQVEYFQPFRLIRIMIFCKNWEILWLANSIYRVKSGESIFPLIQPIIRLSSKKVTSRLLLNSDSRKIAGQRVNHRVDWVSQSIFPKHFRKISSIFGFIKILFSLTLYLNYLLQKKTIRIM